MEGIEIWLRFLSGKTRLSQALWGPSGDFSNYYPKKRFRDLTICFLGFVRVACFAYVSGTVGLKPPEAKFGIEIFVFTPTYAAGKSHCSLNIA